MSSGGPGDHPLTDLFHWGMHPFPSDIESMILRLRDVAPRYLDVIDYWALVNAADSSTRDIERAHLRSLLQAYEVDLAKLVGNEK